MFDQASRSMLLENQVWPNVRKHFPSLAQLPENALITVGYASSGARGRSEKLKPCEVNYQWTGNPNEQVFISVHPIYFDSMANVVKALAFGALKVTGGARWGATHGGLTKEADGTIKADAGAQAKIDAIVADSGELPSGYGLAFPVRTVQRHRLRRYVNSTKQCWDKASGAQHGDHAIIRAASDDLEVICKYCDNPYVKA